MFCVVLLLFLYIRDIKAENQVSVKRYDDDDDDDVVDDGSSLLPTSLVGANEGGGMEVRVEGRPERRREGKKKGGRKAGLAGPAGTVWV